MVSVFRKWGRMLCRDRLYKSRPVGPELLKSSFVLCAFKNLQILDTNETCFKGVNSFRSHLPQVSTLAAASVAGVTMQVFGCRCLDAGVTMRVFVMCLLCVVFSYWRAVM